MSFGSCAFLNWKRKCDRRPESSSTGAQDCVFVCEFSVIYSATEGDTRSLFVRLSTGARRTVDTRRLISTLVAAATAAWVLLLSQIVAAESIDLDCRTYAESPAGWNFAALPVENDNARTMAPRETHSKPYAITQNASENPPTQENDGPPTRVNQPPLNVSIGVSAPPPGRRDPEDRIPPESDRSIADILSEGMDLGPDSEGFKPVDWSQPIVIHRYDRHQGVVGEDIFTVEGDVRFSIGDTEVRADRVTINKVEGSFDAEGDVVIVQGKSRLEAERLRYGQPPPEADRARTGLRPLRDESGTVSMTGSIEAELLHLQEPNRSLTADFLRYDYLEQTGEILNAKGHAGELYFGAESLRVLGPASMSGDDFWVTTCDRDPPHYRLRMSRADIQSREMVLGKNARLQLGGFNTPLYWPSWRRDGDRETQFLGVDFDSGRRAEMGYFLNLGLRFTLSKHSDITYRILPTTKMGVGFGVEVDYDFMEAPTSPLFRSTGSIETLYTTEDDGIVEYRHRQELSPNTLLLGQWEQWSDRDFYKIFYFDRFRDRTEPRTFVNATHTKPNYIATATVRKRTHDFTVETERLPEATFHLLERNLARNLFFTFDTMNGFSAREPSGVEAFRAMNVARLTYDWNAAEALNLSAYVQGEAAAYSEDAREEGGVTRASGVAAVTGQMRFHRAYGGLWSFRGFKHTVVPSVTTSYRPRATADLDEVPFFDYLDYLPGRARIETKLDNIVLGHSESKNEVWQVARVSLYHGNDFWHEEEESHDYEIEIDLRPWPRWGLLAVAERHDTEGALDLDFSLAVQRAILRTIERITGDPFDKELYRRYNLLSDDYNRVLSYVYYNQGDTDWGLNGRLGFAYTETDDDVFNREIIYGLGWKLGEKWSMAFEHRYDLDRDELARQTYEIRRSLHKWETAIQLRDRESGFDISFEIYIAAFPGTRVKF